MTQGVVGAGTPATASTVDDGPTPAPVEPAPSDDPTPAPTPTEPTEPAPTPTAEPSITPTPAPVVKPALPSKPTPLPSASAPDPWAPAPRGSSPSPTPPAIGVDQRTPDGPSATAAPASFGVVYPTNPWIYNGLEGTRYLDVREREGDQVLRYHMGIDAQGGFRQPIFAVAAGTVEGGTWGTTPQDGHGYGNQVVITHAAGFATRYAHLADAPLVHKGQTVVAGQLVGYMGSSQRGAHDLPRHLHFEVTKNGRHIDPIAFLTGARESSSSPSSSTTDAASDGAQRELYEMRRDGDAYAMTSTGLALQSSALTAVAMGGDSAEVMVSEGGTLAHIVRTGEVWTQTDTGLPLDATSIAGADTGNGFPELLAVEDGRLFHIVHGPAGWTKTWTGHRFSGTVSAVALPGGRLHGLLEQAGYLYYLAPADDGRWNIVDTGLEVGASVDAVYIDGPVPEGMTDIGGELHRILWDGLTWHTQPTGLPAGSPLAAVHQAGGWPSAISLGGDGLGLAEVVDGVWTRYTWNVPEPTDAMDAVVIGPDAVIYAVG